MSSAHRNRNHVSGKAEPEELGKHTTLITDDL